jgi:hypothetical protein
LDGRRVKSEQPVPRRSNDFQRLIYLIQQQLGRDAFTVTESKLVRDSTGQRREIDVAVEGTMAGHRVLIAVECRDHARPQDVQWIEQLQGKYRHMAAEKVVAVSASGFTPAARELARNSLAPRIEALSLSDALVTDWQHWFGETMTVSSYRLVWLDDDAPGRAEIILPYGSDLEALTSLDFNHASVQLPDAGSPIPLNALLNACARSDEFVRIAGYAIPEGETVEFRLEIPLPDGTRLLCGEQNVAVEAVVDIRRARQDVREFQLQRGAFANAFVAVGVNRDHLGWTTRVALSQNRCDHMQLTYEIDSNSPFDGLLDLELEGEHLEHLRITPIVEH